MANSADPDQKPTDLDLHCLQRQDISGFSRTRVKKLDQQMTYLMAFMRCFFFLLIFLMKTHVMGSDLNCIDKSTKFKWVPANG